MQPFYMYLLWDFFNIIKKETDVLCVKNGELLETLYCAIKSQLI